MLQKYIQKLSDKLRQTNILKYSVAALLLGVPLYPKFPLITVPGTFVAVRLEDFLILVVSIIWFFTVLPDIKGFFKDSLVRAILIFLGVTFVSFLSALLLTKTVSPHIGFLHWARRVEYVLPFFIGMAVIKKKGDLAFFLKLLIIVYLLAFVYGVGQKYFQLPIVTTQNLEYSKGIALIYTPGGHLPSTFAGHYDMASFIVLTLPIFFGLLFGGVFFAKGKTRLLLITTIIVGFWLLVNAVSRISIVSYLMAVTLTLVVIKKYKLIPAIIVISLVFAAFSGSLLGRYGRIFKVTIEKAMENRILYVVPAPVHAQELPAKREKSTPSPTPVPVFEDRSSSIRFNVEWPRALRAFSKNPLLGTGFSSITLATDNDYLRLLGEVGILGFLSFLLIIYRLARRLIRVLPLPKKLTVEHVSLAGLIGAFPAVLLNALFIDIFEASKFATMFWLIMGFAIGSLRVLNKNVNKN